VATRRPEVGSTRQIIEGKRYEAEVPDTLDLADRARLAINAMTGAINEDLDYEYCWMVSLVPPKLAHHHTVEWFDCNPRAAESLPYFRAVTGSDYRMDIEEKMIASMLSRIGEDGLYYNAPYRDEAPWRKGGFAWPMIVPEGEDYAPAYANGQMIIALLSRYQAGEDPALLEIARRMVDRLIEIAVYKDDYAYYPVTEGNGLCGYRREHGWGGDTREPIDELSSPEGMVTGFYAVVVRAMSRWFAATGDAPALDFAGKLVRFILKPQFWMGSIEAWHESASHARLHGDPQRKPSALFQGHLTGIASTLQGLIEYAIAANDSYLKEFVRQGYEHMRNFGLSRIGMWGENMVNSIMAAIAIKLSDAGVGDYWEDVDQYVRNTMVEDQFVDAALLRQMCRERRVPAEDGEISVERLVGCLRWFGVVNPSVNPSVLDPTQNGVMATGPYLEPLYFAWEGITRCRDGAAQVNLLLNRASSALAIRIPAWTDRKSIRCRIGDNDAPFRWVGNYLTLSGLRKKETVTVEFPMVETTETYYLMGPGPHLDWHRHKESYPEYVLQLKGNTCIKVEFTNRDRFPYGEGGEITRTGYPVYQREHCRASVTPVKKVIRFVAPRVIEW
jgi:hypothetical protein